MEKVTITLIKLSEALHSTVGIKSIDVVSNVCGIVPVIVPAAVRQRLIHFGHGIIPRFYPFNGSISRNYSKAAVLANTGSRARFAAYVNGERVLDEMISEKEMTFEIFALEEFAGFP
mgnify:CR=1 FL=1